LKYCDGTGHQGFKKDPVSYKGKNLYFRGHSVAIGQFSSINDKYKIASVATEVVVTGQSAGGLATFLWANYLA
jgi:O-palmitoleoyl-L-serine hydrolase